MGRFDSRIRPRLNSLCLCLSSPAADTLNAKTAGTFSTVMCMSALSPAASATSMRPRNGNGRVASIQDAAPESIPTAPPRPSTRPALASRWRGEYSCQTAPRPNFRCGAISGIGPGENTLCGQPGEGLPSQMRTSLMTCPCGDVFDSHRLEHTVIHVPHITTTRQANEVRH